MSDSLIGDFLRDHNLDKLIAEEFVQVISPGSDTKGTKKDLPAPPTPPAPLTPVSGHLVAVAESKLTCGSTDAASMRRMFNIWVYKLLHNLDDEHKDLLKFFDLPAQPKTDEDFMKLINSLKIIEHCTCSLEYTNVCLLGVSMLLMWFLRASGNFIGLHLLDIHTLSPEQQADYHAAQDKKLEVYCDKLLNEKYMKKVINTYLSYKVQQCYENLITQKNFKVPSTHPLFIVFSDIIGVVTSYGRDMYMDPVVRGMLKRKHSEIS